MPGNDLTLGAPAKLNLFLHITGRRADGYHELQTVFQLLDYGDELTFRVRNDGQLTLHCSDDNLNTADNLVLRAAQTLQDASACTLGADIWLDKRIPAGAGLGGGSSDAATTLVALNHLWQTRFDENTLMRLGLQLGADVPVFIHGRNAWAEGVGDKLTDIELPPSTFVVITPDCHVSTGLIFSHEQLTRDTSPIKMCAFLAGQSRNDCEPLVRRLYPQVAAALDWADQFGKARMTGTGASVFLDVADHQQARKVLGALQTDPPTALRGARGFIADGVSRSPASLLLAQQTGA